MGRGDMDVVACAAAVNDTGGRRRSKRKGWNQSGREMKGQ